MSEDTNDKDLSPSETQRLIDLLQKFIGTYNSLFVEYKKASTKVLETNEKYHQEMVGIDKKVNDVLKALSTFKYSDTIHRAFIKDYGKDFEDYWENEKSLRVRELELLINEKITSRIVTEPFNKVLKWFTGISVVVFITLILFFKFYYTQTAIFEQTTIKTSQFLATREVQERYKKLEEKIKLYEERYGKIR